MRRRISSSDDCDDLERHALHHVLKNTILASCGEPRPYSLAGQSPVSEGFDYRIAPLEEGDTTGFQVIRVEDSERVYHLRGGDGIYMCQAKGVSYHRPALQEGDYEPGIADNPRTRTLQEGVN